MDEKKDKGLQGNEKIEEAILALQQEMCIRDRNWTDLHSCVRMYGMVLGIQGIRAFLPLKARTWNGGTYGTDHSDQECNKNFYR